MPSWEDLHGLTQDKDSDVRENAAYTLGEIFHRVPDKIQAWQDLHMLTLDDDSHVKESAAYALGLAFSEAPDKTQAWQDLIRLTLDEDRNVRWSAAGALGEVFSQAPDKTQAWQDLHMMTLDEDNVARWGAAYALGKVFSHIPDKTQAWQDLIKLIQDEDWYVRRRAAYALGKVFSQAPDKTQAWQDFIRLTLGRNDAVRWCTADALGKIFPQAPDKTQAWQDLHMLTLDEDSYVKESAAYVLGKAFPQVPDKTQAWQDLVRLTLDKNSVVRWGATGALCEVFSQAPDKTWFWQDLHMLTLDKDWYVKENAAYALGKVFSHIPDKTQAWQDLIRLTRDNDSSVRMYAYDSLGKASVFKATEAESTEALKKKLKTAIYYFGRSSQEEANSPAKFCYPFYCTYFAITFQEAKEDEVQKYLAKAKKAVGNSKSKDELLKTTENLARALQESQRLKGKSIEDIQRDLNAYRLYCEKAAEFMKSAEDKAPVVVKLMRKCNLILDEKIKATIAEIQRTAELISPEIDQAARCLSLDDPIKVHQCCMRMASALRSSCKRLSAETSELTCGVLTNIEKEDDLSVVLGKIELAMAYTLPAVEAERKEILDRLRNIEFGISKLNFSSGSARQDLYELKTDIRCVQDKIASQNLNIEDLSKVLREKDYAMIERLERMRDDWLVNVEKLTQGLPSCKDLDIILKEIQSLKQSKRRDILGITGDISSIAGIFIGLIGLAYTINPL